MSNTSQHTKPVEQQSKRYARVSEAIEQLGVTERTIRRWCKSGRLSATKDRQGGLLISASDIEQERANRAAMPRPVSVVDLQQEVADLRQRLSDCEALVQRLMEMIEGEQGTCG